MSNETDDYELAEIIGLQFEHPSGPGCGICIDVDRAAKAVLNAGYRKPHTIQTAEGLDSLPDGSAILDGAGDVGQKLSGWWHFPETAPMGSSKVAKYGPAIILYTPDAAA